MRIWIALSLWQGMTVTQLQRVLAVCQCEEQLFHIPEKEWLQLGLPARLLATRVLPRDRRVDRVMDWLQAPDHHLITWQDEAYPSLLRELNSPPLLLYASGAVHLLQRKQVAIVGSRRATPRALRWAHQLAADLAAEGVVITSGLALGIDTVAHQGALAGGGQTVAVMANGLGQVYPLSNQKLAQQIQQQGVLVSEQPPWMEPRAALFPQRNRIVSGLCQGVVVVQARRKSGSLITARLALEQNREVMAVPGDAGCPQSGGCHDLLKDGAALVECAEDVMQCLGWQRLQRQAKQRSPPPLPLSAEQQQLLSCIDSAGTALDIIYERYEGRHEDVLLGLSQLELLGAISRCVEGYCQC